MNQLPTSSAWRGCRNVQLQDSSPKQPHQCRGMGKQMWGAFGLLHPLWPLGSGTRSSCCNSASWPCSAEQEQQPVTLLGQNQARVKPIPQSLFQMNKDTTFACAVGSRWRVLPLPLPHFLPAPLSVLSQHGPVCFAKKAGSGLVSHGYKAHGNCTPKSHRKPGFSENHVPT